MLAESTSEIGYGGRLAYKLLRIAIVLGLQWLSRYGAWLIYGWLGVQSLVDVKIKFYGVLINVLFQNGA